MFGSIRLLALPLIAVALTVSACATGAQEKPDYFDSDIPGKAAKKAEFPGCTPRTETGPILIDGKLPEYPRREAASGYIGSVDVRFIITETGATSNVETLRATSRRYSTASNDRFAAEVESAVGNWIFEPAMNLEMPVAVVCAQRHIFNEAGVTVIQLETRLAAASEG